MAYTYDLATAIGQVRLTIGDVPNSQGTAFFTDAELQNFITAANGDNGSASVQALYNWSRRLSQMPKQQIGDYTVDYSAQAKQLSSAADTLAQQLDDELDDSVVGSFGGDLWVRD